MFYHHKIILICCNFKCHDNYIEYHGCHGIPIEEISFVHTSFKMMMITIDAEAAPPVRLVRLWPDHFSSRPDIRCSVVTHNLYTYMQTWQWHLFLVLVVGLPLKLHSSQGLFFPKTAILMLRERFLIAENTCENFFPHFVRTDQRFMPLRYE